MKNKPYTTACLVKDLAADIAVVAVLTAIPFLVVLGTCSAHAANKTQSFYTDANGQRMEVSIALISSVKGETIYKCQLVEAKVSKSGTSLGLRSVKQTETKK